MGYVIQGKLNDKFEQIVYDPSQWKSKGVELHGIVKRLEPQFDNEWIELKKLNGKEIDFDFFWFTLMTCGFSLENIIKGLLIRKSYIIERKTINPNGLPSEIQTHDLVKLLEKYDKSLVQNVDFLDKLTSCTLWRGHYPSSNSSAKLTDMKVYIIDGEKLTSFHSSCESDDLIKFYQFYNKLIKLY